MHSHLVLRFQGGSNLFDKQVMAEKLAVRYAHDPDWMSELAEQISFDRHVNITSDAVPDAIESFLREKEITNRMPYARPLASTPALCA